MSTLPRIRVVGCRCECVLGVLLLLAAFAWGTETPPLIADEERHLAINAPDRFAWTLFARINRPIEGDPGGRVQWEGWALARDAFADPNRPPRWPEAPAPRRTERLERLPLQQRIRITEAGGSQPEFDARAAEGQFNETRMNRTAFDYVVANDLYYVEGQEAFFFRNENLDFPLEAMETKAQWRRIEVAQAGRYHTARTTNEDGTEQLWGLTSLHITTKDLPNWFWATFEHKDNPGIDAVVPSRDSYGLPDELKGTKWQNYVLRGTQVDFVDSVGRPTILANSQIENGFQRTSSCITCHARATIGERPRDGSDVNRLSVFEGDRGSIGAPNAAWFVDLDRFPQSREYVQLDFVWSLFRAQRRGLATESEAVREAVSPPVAGVQKSPETIAGHDPLKQFDEPQFTAELPQVRPLIHLQQAHNEFNVDGAGLTVAVLDTGLRTTHVDFLNRVPAQRNFTADNGNDPDNASDGDGHGTNVAGITVADGNHDGIAPKAAIIPLKVLPNSGGGSFGMVRDALQWVKDNRATHNITVVNMSLGDSGNYTSDNFGNDAIRNLIRDLRDQRVAVVVAAGNDFFTHDSVQGMGYPGIFRETVSVGAVYDANEGGFTYSSGASAVSSAPDQITPFSQRLHESLNADLRIDIFAPGAPVTSSGINTDVGESVQHGTSQAAPVTSGVILLMQQYHLRETGELPTVDDLEAWLRRGGVPVADDHGPIDNVMNTGKSFVRIDALGALRAIQTHLERRLLETGQPLKSKQ